ncbi:putative transcriptional regulatory protein [Colletotrichum trifolii]|uniref:Putative transcriptional regulatory protein n=1 Tax=Colletotrichum trifolii TaxID=5466 RepID=A0A4R8RKG5_COLTR|nr:putative transcriptional regulatory protein [Colletotrichum trifolii]
MLVVLANWSSHPLTLGPITEISFSSEKKIDLIDRRLDGVVRLLEDLKLQLPKAAPAEAAAELPKPAPLNAVPVTQRPVASSAATPASHGSSTQTTDPMLEGESSMTAQSIFAHEFLQKTVGDASSVLELRETLDSLHSLVEALKQQPAAHELTYPRARPVPRPSFSHYEMPPVQSAVAVIREAKALKILGLEWVTTFLHPDHFVDLTLKIYFSPTEFNEAEFIIVNSGLESLYMDMTMNKSVNAEQKQEYAKMGAMCGGNLETALANLPLHLPATMDMIVALLFGAYHAVEVAKPSLAWTLNCAAVQLCQSLGYHRITTVRSGNRDDEDYKTFLFWSVYFLDKSLSLRLGRPSTCQDYDITIPYPSSSSKAHGVLMSYFYLWVIVAGIQGKTYEQLYSPEAVSQPASIREGRARGLAAELKRVTEQTQQTHAQYLQPAIEAIGQNAVDFFTVSDEVLRLSLLAVIYRAVPSPPGFPTTFCTECIEAARATLQRHQDCMEIMARDSYYLFPMYMNWTILFAPFVPFIVVFCQVMETQDEADLARLQAFAASIQAAKEFTEASARIYRLFQVLYNVAFRYVEIKNNSQQAEQEETTQEMDKYLAALGFPPAGHSDRQSAEVGHTEQLGGGLEDGINPAVTGSLSQMMWMGNASQLEDWFYSNQQMMGLVEDEDSFLQ